MKRKVNKLSGFLLPPKRPADFYCIKYRTPLILIVFPFRQYVLPFERQALNDIQDGKSVFDPRNVKRRALLGPRKRLIGPWSND